jgi:hypothetical protein
MTGGGPQSSESHAPRASRPPARHAALIRQVERTARKYETRVISCCRYALRFGRILWLR